MITTAELREKLENYYGSMTFTRVSSKLIATEGVVAFAQLAEAYWFLNTVDVLLRTVPEDSFYDVKLFVKNQAGVITITDGNYNVYTTHKVDFTDCPEGEWEFFVEQSDEQMWTILLPSEH